MKSVKTIAGDVLLYFYTTQRKKGSNMYEVLSFVDGKEIQLPSDENLVQDLKKIAVAADIYNALNYLKDYRYLDYNVSESNMGDSMQCFRVTAFGMDIIEGIERDTMAKEQFTVNFNIKLADNVTVESLIKMQLGSIFSGSFFGM